MSKNKVIENGYILAIGENLKGEEITETEYNEILSVLKSAPHVEGKGYKLKTDLTWEEYDLPVPEEEPTAEEIVEILTGEET